MSEIWHWLLVCAKPPLSHAGFAIYENCSDDDRLALSLTFDVPHTNWCGGSELNTHLGRIERLMPSRPARATSHSLLEDNACSAGRLKAVTGVTLHIVERAG
jgi:hypothetical protein